VSGGPACRRQGVRALLVIGIDPGIRVCGYGLVEAAHPGARPAALAWGALRVPGEGAQRLAALHAALAALLAEHRPVAAAVERLYHTRNVSSALAVGQARGVALLACAAAGLAIAEYTPTEMKLAVTGHGRADKGQVRRMVAAQLGLRSLPSPDDAADALGLCLCHLAGQGLRARVAAADAAGGRAP